MKTIILAALALCACGQHRLPFKGEGGEIIYVSDHERCRPTLGGTDFVSTHHYPKGRMYGISLLTGKLVPPGVKGEPTVLKVIWMCRYHVSEWIGTDPETGHRAEWMPRVDGR